MNDTLATSTPPRFPSALERSTFEDADLTVAQVDNVEKATNCGSWQAPRHSHELTKPPRAAFVQLGRLSPAPREKTAVPLLSVSERLPGKIFHSVSFLCFCRRPEKAPSPFQAQSPCVVSQSSVARPFIASCDTQIREALPEKRR